MAGEQGLSGRPGRLPAAHAGAAPAREGRRQGEEDRSRRRLAYTTVAQAAGATTFTGYDEVVTEGVVRGLSSTASPVAAAAQGGSRRGRARPHAVYAEGGGQLPDHGYIQLSNGAQVEVYDVQSPLTGIVCTAGRSMAGELTVDLAAQSVVDVGAAPGDLPRRTRRRPCAQGVSARRWGRRRRSGLGERAWAGSASDFSSPTAVPGSVLHDVEQAGQELLLQDLEVRAEIMTQQEAIASGAMALFGEKYGDQVRVVTVGDWARELCGGTHARRSGQLGVVKLLGEASIGAGVRRVEALVGADAYHFLAREHALVSTLTDTLKVRPEELPDRVAALAARLREVEKELERTRTAQALQAAASLAAGADDVFGVSVVRHHAADGTAPDALRRLAIEVRGRLGNDRPAVVATAAKAGDRPAVVVAVNDAARTWGVRAGDLVRSAAQVLGGGGGGKDDLAQGGGTDPSKIDEALVAVQHAVGQRVTSGS
jgi:alanyl-tRNA synthetase